MSEKGRCYVIAAPSGAGKTSLVKALARRFDHIKISISYTTRPPRDGEKHGVDYYFVSEAEFKSMIKNEQLLEYAIIYGNYYGTSRDWVVNQLIHGNDIVLEIDWQGARQIRSHFHQAVLVFILPPSLQTLRERLISRGKDHDEIIATRIAGARHEMMHYREFDYLIVNDDFEYALKDLVHIVKAERLHTRLQEQKLSDLLEELLEKQ